MLHLSRERSIPKIIQKSDLNTIKGFLRAFIESEGHVHGKRKNGKHQSTIEVSSASQMLITELSYLLLRFGIVSRIAETKKMATNGTRIPRPYWRLTIGGEFARRYIQEIGFITERKRDTCTHLFNIKSNTNIDVVPNIGSELKRVREVLGLSQFKIGIKRTTYQHYERGDRNPTRGNLYLIAQEFMNQYTQLDLEDVQLRHDITNLMKLAISDIFWDKIASINEIPCEEYVYDVEVEGTHNFISNGIYSHNSVLLQATDKIAPKSVYVSGKGSSSAGLCVAPDSLILNDSGFKPIQEFVETKFDNDVKREELPGAFSNEFSGQTHSLTGQLDFVIQPIEKIWKIKAPSKMIQFTTRTGRELSLTPATSLIRLKSSKAEWIEASELQNEDYIAVPRFLPEGKRKNIPTFTVLLDDPYIKIGTPLAEWMKEIIEKLVPKYGSKQAIAKKIGKSRDTIYAIQNPKFHHGWELQKVVELAREAGYSDDQIARKITTLFIRHGITNRIPPYLDDPDVAYLVGSIIGDGSMEQSDDRTTIRLCGNDPQILERCSEILREKFGIIPEKEKNIERVPSIRMSSRILGKILYAYGMRHEKKDNALSHMATEMPNHVLRNLLQGLFDTDGCADDSKTGGKNVSISSISPSLAQTIHLSLLKFGIISKKRFRKRAGNVAVGKKITVISRNDQYCIEIYGKRNLQQFREKIGFGLSRKQETLDKIIQSIHHEKTNIDFVPEIVEALQETSADSQYKKGKARISYSKLKELMKNEEDGFLQKLSNANILWDQIKVKKEFKPHYEYVYDMTVSGSHNFIANGFYVHNTASAVKDDFGEGGWTLKAGALVLASGGMVMVDEFDKMEPEDRSAMHEAMEQGQVSVAKAGMVTRFKTDTSVLAAANPKLSRFDTYKPFFEQIDLPASLISRFDLFFMIRDTLDKKKDETIAAHILATHRAGEQLLQMSRGNKQINAAEIQLIQEKVSPMIDVLLLRKYISYARQRVFPILSHEAVAQIQEFYVGLRDQGRQAGSYSATARQLEGLVRLAEASARVRLSDEVGVEDAERAIRLVKSSLEDVVKDPETGRIDIDIITSGQTQSSRDHMRVITEIVKSKGKEMDRVPIQDVIAEALSRGIEEEKVRDLITKLKKAGDIYEPSHGFLKSA